MYWENPIHKYIVNPIPIPNTIAQAWLRPVNDKPRPIRNFLHVVMNSCPNYRYCYWNCKDFSIVKTRSFFFFLLNLTGQTCWRYNNTQAKMFPQYHWKCNENQLLRRQVSSLDYNGQNAQKSYNTPKRPGRLFISAFGLMHGCSWFGKKSKNTFGFLRPTAEFDFPFFSWGVWESWSAFRAKWHYAWN